MSEHPRGGRARTLLALAVAGGLLLQAGAVSCNQIAAEVVAGISTSIANQLIQNTVSEALGLPTTGGLGGLSGGLGT